MKPGLYPGLTYEQYDEIDAVRSTVLKGMEPTPMHCRHKATTPDEGKAHFRIGDLLHMAIGEPDLIDRQIAVAPDHLFTQAGEPRKRLPAEGKLELAEWLAANASKRHVSRAQYDQVRAMVDSFHLPCHSEARELMTAPGQAEVVAVWRDAETELLCKARMDRVVRWRGATWVPDLKSSRSAAQWAFAQDIRRYGYDLSAAMYLDGLSHLQEAERHQAFVVIEKEPPYGVAMYVMEGESAARGRQFYRSALSRYAMCQHHQDWPGYPNRAVGIEVPPRFIREDDDE